MRRVDVALLIPIKAFHVAKARMAPVLDEPSRERLARWTAARVIAAADGAPVFVACDDERVAEWSRDHDALVLSLPGLGLNAAVDAAVDEIRARGFEHVVIAHADLPIPDALMSVAKPGTVTLVPDRRLDGTNVRSFPVRLRLTSSYGQGSFQRHLDAALASGAPVEVLRHPHLALDLDTPADLAHPLATPLLQEVLPTWQRTNPGNPTPVTRP